jgi:thiosulfate reductase cytochrome b subunit|tara:strand:- start:667 stop:933 length:267 start_codon:yes stop_codon:yes gene_type:complete
MSAKVQKQMKEENKLMFAFNKTNYIIVIVGLLVIITGFLLMVGGGSDDPEVFSEAIFGFRRLTLAPILIIVGYMIEIFAIMYRPKQTK